MSEEPNNRNTVLIVGGIVAAVIAIGGCCVLVLTIAAVAMPFVLLPARSVSVSQVVTVGPMFPITPTPTPVFVIPNDTLPTITPTPLEGLPTPRPTTTTSPAELDTPAAGQGSQGVVAIENIHLDIVKVLLDHSFPAGCTDKPPACTTAQGGYQILSVFLVPIDLPESQMLLYKNTLGEVTVEINTGEIIPLTVQMYNNATRNLTIGFEVPDGAAGFILHWPGSDAVALTIAR